MTLEVALAMLHRQGRWLMQRRDDISGPVAPRCWGLFGGHLNPGETPGQALRRELLEGRDMALVSSQELLTGAIWSSRLQEHRPLADGLVEVMRQGLLKKREQC